MTARLRGPFAALIGVVVLALTMAAPAVAVDPGAVKLGRTTGCPIFYYPTDPSIPPSALLHSSGGEHCVQLSTPDVFWKEGVFGGGCAKSLLVQDAIPQGIDNYVIVVFSEVGAGTQLFYPPGQRKISILSGNATYTAPRGSVVYGVAGGASGAPCPPNVKNWLYAKAWGMSNRPTISGTVTDADHKPINDAIVYINGPTSVVAKVGADGTYSELVKPGHYTVRTYFESSTGQRFPLNVTRCAPGAAAGDQCDAAVHGKSVTADFRLARPKVNITFDPRIVPGDGRGATNVTIRLTLDGIPVNRQELAGVANVAGPKRAAPYPSIFTSPGELFQEADPNREPIYPPVIGCVGSEQVGIGPLAVTRETDGQGEVNFRMFVGTDNIGLVGSGIGPELRLSVTDILDKLPLPGLKQSSALLHLAGARLFAENAPAPDGLRYFAKHGHRPPALTGDEHDNQLALLNWLTEIASDEFASGHRFAEFGPIVGAPVVGAVPIAGPNVYAVYFQPRALGPEPAPGLTEPVTPVLDIADAKAIFGSDLLPSALPLAKQTELYGPTESPFFLREIYVFYGDGIYPDPRTADGRQIEDCARGYWADTYVIP
jgi:hypothetical protein